MPALSHPTRELLLSAGLELAEQHGLPNISVDQIVRAAGVSKGTFYVHFPDRQTYLVTLHRQFHDHLRALVLADIEGMPFGAARLHRAALAYLEGCLAGKAVKALLLDARSERAITDEIQARNADFTQLAAADFIAMGWPHPESAARLYVALCAEAALIELEVGRRDEAVRESLRRYLAG